MYKNIIYFFLGLCFIFLGITVVQAQPATDRIPKLIPKVTPQSPNAASLGKYGDYQVNLFTGLPQISIPLYEVKSGSLTVPISLSYHAAGIKYTDQASWVGLGWTLNAGGMISRRVGGLPDEDSYLASTLKATINICQDNQYYKDITNNLVDGEPDLFSYAYPGGSGKFILRQTAQDPLYNNPLIIPYAPIKIDGDITTGSPGVIREFALTDEGGVSYRFGKNALNQSVIETTNSQNGGQTSDAETSWLLTQMSAPNSNDQITFNYQTGGASISSDASFQTMVIDQCYNGYADGVQKHVPNNGANATEILSYSSISTQNLSEILFENGRIEFTTPALPNRSDQTNLKSLSQIKIFSKVNNVEKLLKTITFTYSYFKDKANVANLRLKLDAIQIQDAGGVVQDKYSFQYHTTKFSWDRPTASRARDYWGYYNGKEAVNTDLIPKQTINYQENLGSPSTNTTIIGGANDRNTNPAFMIEGVLKRIDFPTGGYSEFDFETNRYQESDNSTVYTGGLRVAQIRSYDGFSASPITKTYKYGLNESGFGNKNFIQSLSFYNYVMNYYYGSCLG